MEEIMIELEQFLELPTPDVAQLVKASGAKVVVFPINGTRRWFMLEYGKQKFDDPLAAYTDIVIKRHIELYKLFFDHGIETLVTPVIGAEVLATRDDYMEKIGAEGLASIARRPDFLSFYDEYNVRVRFYGDYERALKDTAYTDIVGLFNDLTQKTLTHERYRLFFGVFADDRTADEATARSAIEHFRSNGAAPDRRAIVEAYYGEYVEKADIFIGFDRLAVFDYPLLRWGGEDLYFTITPSLYMTSRQLRLILYDHLYTRRVDEPDYLSFEPGALEQLKSFYTANQDIVLGTGKLNSNIWYPTNP
jgi:adenosine tuberculosinyltransferase